MKILRPLSFSLMGIIVLLLIIASFVEQIYGSEFVAKYFYTAPWTIALWFATAISAITYIFTIKMWKNQIFTFTLHFSFVVILAGAMVTHLFGKQGEVHLRLDNTNTELTDISLPFPIKLNAFHLEYYPGTQAPMDFVSEITTADKNGVVSMNNIYTYKNYRFYQAQYDSDMRGVTLRISYDPWGIGITYAGYALLLLSMIFFFFQKRTYFRSLINHIKGASVIILLLLPLSLQASPRTVSAQTASDFCNLYLYYNDRVCPMQTLATEFTTKLYGKPTYKGMNAEQVLCGWLFYYDDWAKEDCIKIKGKDIRNILGIDGKYACLNDFVGNGKYKLENALSLGNKNARAADEKFQLISMVCTGTLMRIYPILDDKNNIYWYSWSDILPPDVSQDDWQFVYRSMDFVFLCVARQAQSDAQDALKKIRAWQQTKANDNLPSESRFKAEKIYNSVNLTRPLAMTCATLGIILFIVACALLSNGKSLNTWAHFTLTGIMIMIWLYLTLSLSLRWLVSGHIPLSNGYETMQFMSWISAFITAVLCIRNVPSRSLGASLYLPFGFLICGMTMMVSMMSQANPQITNLMPVLQSPLLTLHVAIIMIAYCLLAFITLNGIMALIIRCTQKKETIYSGGRLLDGSLAETSKKAQNIYYNKEAQIKHLQAISQILLYPAIFCLTIGIFLGAIWANISWGRYWGWDPKEVWALITMLVYAVLLHTSSVKFLQKPLYFHIYSVLAFLFVLFTYFGVNFILGGLHSYA